MNYCKKTSLFICVISVIALGCTNLLQRKGDHSVGFFITLQFPTMNGSIHTMNDSILIYQNDHYLIYDQSVLQPRSIVNIYKNKGDSVSEEELSPLIFHKYFIIKKTENYGLLYDSINANKPTSLSLDSFLRGKDYRKYPFYLLSKSYKVASNIMDKGDLVEKLIDPSPEKDNPDTLVLLYNKNLDLGEITLSRELDSIKKSKLYKVTFIYNPKKTDGVNYDRREMNFELRKVSFDKKNIQYLINKYQSDKASGHVPEKGR